ncbi:urease accessory protein UreD [Limnofasciculus baicalensis]|uniref:Urease accessory protein UreD n=1 Tax=Limnofasciculus baicalensis BBK-W-15 TaxID=2699891 RepID=A0AAE3GVW0_9CYAN|nr:urease accessory protein UreD [Limnofasciculus baicalensis BBK-W-15]
MNTQVTSLTTKPREVATGWHGSLELVYAYNQSKTQLIHSQSRSPLKVQRPFYPEGEGICHTAVLHTAGGIVGGDILSQTIHLQPNSQALLTTVAASKIYGSRGRSPVSPEGQAARQTIDIKVDAGAILEWLPQETIVFNGAVYQQDLRVKLASGASWLGWEITRFGRTARGERFLQGEWRSHTEIWQEGKPLWIDRQWLPGGEEILNSPHGLAGQPIVASLIYIGQPVSSEIITEARNIWMAKARQGEAGVTQTMGDGLLCRYRGGSTSEVRNWFTEVWQLLRLSHSGLAVTKPRFWPL